MTPDYMPAAEVRAFISGQTVCAVDPETGEAFADVTYSETGKCTARMRSGQVDEGTYGFDGDTYWTRYAAFRGGERHEFRLANIDARSAQAYHGDGRKAFLLIREREQ